MKPFSGTAFDVCLFVKIRRSSWMENRRGESHGVKRQIDKEVSAWKAPFKKEMAYKPMSLNG